MSNSSPSSPPPETGTGSAQATLTPRAVHVRLDSGDGHPVVETVAGPAQADVHGLAAVFNLNTAETETVATAAGLRALPHDKRRVPYTLGSDAADDGGGGFWHFDPASAAADDGVRVVEPASVGGGMGRFLRLSSEAVLRASWWGLRADPAVEAATRLHAAVEAAASDLKPLVLDGGHPSDPTHGYLLDGPLNASGIDNLSILCPTGFARMVQVPNQGYVSAMLVGGFKPDNMPPVRRSGITLDGLHFVRQNNSGATLRIQYVDSVRLGRISGEGAGGGLVSARDGVHDLTWERGWGKDLGPVGALLFQAGDGRRFVLGHMVCSGGQEAIDTSDIDGLQIGSLVSISPDEFALELSSARNVQVGRIYCRGSGNGVVMVKLDAETEGLPSQDIHIESVVGAEWATRPAALGAAIQINNSIPVTTPARAAGTAIRRVRFGHLDLVSTQPRSKGLHFVVSNSGVATRPRGSDFTIGRASIDCVDYGAFAQTCDRVDWGDTRLRVQAPTEAALYATDCDGVSGRLTVSGRLGVVARLNGSPPDGLSIVQVLDAREAAAGGDPRMGAGVLVQNVNRGVLRVRLDGVRNYGIDLGTSPGAPPGEERLVLVVDRIQAGTGRGVAGTGYTNLVLVGPDGQPAYVESTGERAVELLTCARRFVRVRVKSGALASSLQAAATLSGNGPNDDEVEVVGSAARGVTYTPGVGGFRLRVTGGNTFGSGLVLGFPGAWVNDSCWEVWARMRNCGAAGGFTWTYVVSENAGFPVRGGQLTLQAADSRAPSGLNGLRTMRSAANAGLVLDGCMLDLQFVRARAGDAYVETPSHLNTAAPFYRLQGSV